MTTSSGAARMAADATVVDLTAGGDAAAVMETACGAPAPGANARGPRRLLLREDMQIRGLLDDEAEARALFARRVPNPATVVRDRLTLTTKSFSSIRLGRDARRVLTQPNAGGNSIRSEVLSMEYLATRFQARDVTTEMEVEYWSPSWKKVDFTCTVGSGEGTRVGVSVTRAMGYPSPASFTRGDARRLLSKKLHGLVVARVGCNSRHWFWGDAEAPSARPSGQRALAKSVLHVLCQSEGIADAVAAECPGVCRELGIHSDVIVLLTTIDAPHANAHAQVFFEKDKQQVRRDVLEALAGGGHVLDNAVPLDEPLTGAPVTEAEATPTAAAGVGRARAGGEGWGEDAGGDAGGGDAGGGDAGGGDAGMPDVGCFLPSTAALADGLLSPADCS